eukprot:CAMPEP_0179344928 /NCGR_PEP_ID=MMETSP0797-20121207/71770_1 /TAXON_ID=47934 /ORGANISM="Dinophysis acuminata, Strain DAEP01" /LENGTH=67 /DNA_ID=CAMNT_0021059379 /DNA_START=745 /DNA_END=944 /DNA_ORIENTATION=+
MTLGELPSHCLIHNADTNVLANLAEPLRTGAAHVIGREVRVVPQAAPLRMPRVVGAPVAGAVPGAPV